MKTLNNTREFSAGEISKKAMEILTLRGCEVWRTNNIAVKGRKFIGRKGVSDITGYVKATGVAVYVEVKKIGDTLKDDQVFFLTMARKAGAMVMIATQDKQTREFILKEFQND